MRPLLAAALFALAACGAPDTPAPPAAPSEAPAPVQAAPPAPYRFVGLWAASEAMCADPAWEFREFGVSTQGEVNCTFNHVLAVADGYDVNASCVAQAPPEEHTIVLRLEGQGERMRVAQGPWSAPITLVRCGDLPEPPE